MSAIETNFSDLALHERVLKALAALEYEHPTEVQSAVIPVAKTGVDMIVSAKTGSGKTAAFILPMLERFLEEDRPRSGTRALVLVPTRELALQIQKAFRQLAKFTHIKSGLIIGGEAFKYQVATIRKNPELIIATPGRLVEHIEKKSIDFHDLEMLVLDEADRMLDMGFSEALHQIFEVSSPNRQTLLFSATFKHKAYSRVRARLNEPKHIQIEEKYGENTNILQQRVLADDDGHKEKLVVSLCEQHESEKVIVFCNTRLQAQKLSNIVRANKIRADYIHGEISQSDRKQVLNRFRDGTVRVLVATDVAARGLDIDELALVINFNVAQSGDDHVHRVGRVGRAGNQGVSITLVNSVEWNRMSSIERYLRFRFEPLVLDGLSANYKGPKKVKSSGKAFGAKKKKNKPKSKVSAKKKSALNKKAEASSKKEGRPKVERSKGGKNFGDGSAPLKKK